MRLVLVALAAARLVAAGDSGLDFLPADTKVVFGIHVSAIAESAIFKDAGVGAQKLGEDWLKLVAITGFDPLHDIDEVLLALVVHLDDDHVPLLPDFTGDFELEGREAALVFTDLRAVQVDHSAIVGGAEPEKDAMPGSDGAIEIAFVPDRSFVEHEVGALRVPIAGNL